MSFWTVYDKKTGSIISCFYTTEADNVKANTPSGCLAIEGQSNPLHHYVAGGVICEKPQHEVSAIERAFEREAIMSEALVTRSNLLASSDWTQVSDAPVDQAAWRAYRQALRDITEQEGFPTDIVWPTPPS